MSTWNSSDDAKTADVIYVFDELEWSGLYDEHGNKLMRARRPIGFDLTPPVEHGIVCSICYGKPFVGDVCPGCANSGMI